MQDLAEDLNFPYTISQRDVRYPRLEFRTGTLLVVLPKGQDEKRVLKKHRHWIDRKYQFIKEVLDAADNLHLESRSKDMFKRLVQESIDTYSRELGPAPNNIYIKSMKTKWASCSNKGNITINARLRHLPDRLVMYVIFHEMVHLTYRKHDGSFWKYIRNKFPDTDELEKNLCVYWFVVQRE